MAYGKSRRKKYVLHCLLNMQVLSLVEQWVKNKEEEERRLKELEEKEKANRLAVEQILLEDITTTVIASAELETAETVRRNKEEEAVRMEEEIRKEKEAAELAVALLEEEEAKAADEARKLAAETQTAVTGILDIPVVSAEQTDELEVFMTQVAVNVERNVNLVMKTLAETQAREEERKIKEEFYDSSLATLFDLVKKGEEDRRRRERRGEGLKRRG